ncbi:MAG TPA: hypothetical protein VE133_18810, partial [Candidatus Sulfotelmatobacter sp.]|nr:hypothetical protein [Candidatus Sulfotelmatobacter sp.]
SFGYFLSCAAERARKTPSFSQKPYTFSSIRASSKSGGVSRRKGKRNWRECVAVSDKKGAVRMEASNKPACHWRFSKKPVW